MADGRTKGWMILIGLNFYIRDRPLKGCVRDVEALKQYIQLGCQMNDLDVFLLTASGPSATDPTRPSEEPERLPTYENVVQCLMKVMKLSKPGDTVYVHFSGHGTRVPHTGAFALVLYDHEQGSRLLHGQLLSSVLERMTEKGLYVTLALDCCFSGTVLRTNEHSYNGIRETHYNPAVDVAYPFPDADMNPFRDAIVLPPWLVSPNYTILTACGPLEIAEEIETESRDSKGKERRGALSYFLLEALISLRRRGIDVSHSSLYQHLLTKFHTYWPRQTPMRRGNRNLSFFGKLRVGLDLEFIPVFMMGDDRIFLDAGHAHDVQDGDEYALYPFDTSEAISNQTELPGQRFRVILVGCLTSELTAIGPANSGYLIETGWKARLLTRFASQRASVRVATGMQSRTEWIKAAEHRSLLKFHLSGEKENCLFNVQLNENDHYEVLDAKYAKMACLSPVSAKEQNAIEHILDVLEHLANFKRFEGVENRVPSASFERSFVISSANQIRDTGAYQVKHGDELQFEVGNISDKALYVTLFDLRPSGQIINLMSESGVEFIVVEPHDTESLFIKMEMPAFVRQRGENGCDDIMKFFVASKGLYFPLEVLPKLSPSPGSLRGGSRNGSDYDPLASFLARLESQFRGSEDTTWDNQWATRNFLVRTVKE
ncbi:MAG: hypothetical protein Q9223_003113 [Gallowayella weberi]